jgi:hypothetical protein
MMQDRSQIGSGSCVMQRLVDVGLRSLGAGQRDDQIDLSATIQHISDTAQNAIYAPVGSEAIHVHNWQRCALRNQFVVVHDEHSPAQAREYPTTTVAYPTQKFHNRGENLFRDKFAQIPPRSKPGKTGIYARQNTLAPANPNQHRHCDDNSAAEQGSPAGSFNEIHRRLS